jgi:hypothetical protein
MGEKNRDRLAQLGLWRLMLKLPAIRARLQIVSAQSDELSGLFEAYEEASVALERFLKEKGQDDCPLIAEYEAICTEIENDIVHHVSRRGRPV